MGIAGLVPNSILLLKYTLRSYRIWCLRNYTYPMTVRKYIYIYYWSRALQPVPLAILGVTAVTVETIVRVGTVGMVGTVG